MPRIEWSPSWSVGDDRLDHEHQSLVALINRLVEPEIRESNDPQVRRACVAEVILYAENHFRYEEDRMEQVKYPNLEGHRAGHMRFRRQISQLTLGAFEETPGLLSDLHTFLIAWLKNHILDEDQRYAAYLVAGPE
ncbi:MAG: hemerythrin family protein [Acidobacteria bacterium]|nr:hemerythrin family protein [Acidobacteriota bacterium]